MKEKPLQYRVRGTPVPTTRTRGTNYPESTDVLIIDDFLTLGINQRGQEDLTKIIFDRDGRLPTIISSQSTAAYWLQALPDRVGADSLVSRLNNGHRIQLGDYDIRQALTPPESQ